MKKRMALWALPCFLLLAIAGVYYLQSWPRSEAEHWLERQSQDVEQIEVSYGSGWPGSIWKYISIRDQASIRKVMTSLRCTGSLTNTKTAKADDGLLGYNTSYFITLIPKNPERRAETLVINPSNDRSGIYFLTRRNHGVGVTQIDIIGWAEMNALAFKRFQNTLKSVPGRRRADRH